MVLVPPPRPPVRRFLVEARRRRWVLAALVVWTIAVIAVVVIVDVGDAATRDGAGEGFVPSNSTVEGFVAVVWLVAWYAGFVVIWLVTRFVDRLRRNAESRRPGGSNFTSSL